jgi:hypothetical protein
MRGPIGVVKPLAASRVCRVQIRFALEPPVKELIALAKKLSKCSPALSGSARVARMSHRDDGRSSSARAGPPSGFSPSRPDVMARGGAGGGSGAAVEPKRRRPRRWHACHAADVQVEHLLQITRQPVSQRPRQTDKEVELDWRRVSLLGGKAITGAAARNPPVQLGGTGIEVLTSEKVLR